MAHNPTVVGSKRGGKHPGAGRKKQADRGKDVRIRISETQHLRWNKLKNLKKLPNDDAVAKNLVDLASGIDEEDESSAK